MKKLVFILLPVIFLMLFSCQGQKYDILSYQEKEIEADCTLNGEYKIKVSKKDGVSSVSFAEPLSLSYFSFTLKDGEIKARAHDLEIPLNNESYQGVYALLSMFSLSDECLVYAGTNGESEVFEFSSNTGEYKLTMGEAGVPKTIEITGGSFSFDITIDAIKLN